MQEAKASASHYESEVNVCPVDPPEGFSGALRWFVFMGPGVEAWQEEDVFCCVAPFARHYIRNAMTARTAFQGFWGRRWARVLEELGDDATLEDTHYRVQLLDSHDFDGACRHIMGWPPRTRYALVANEATLFEFLQSRYKRARVE